MDDKQGGLMIAIGLPKHRMPPGKPDKDRPPMFNSKPPGGLAPEPNAEGGAISPEEAGFHDQSQSCGNCTHFDMDGNDGQGVCKKGVQVDYGTSYADASWCKLWEEGAAEKEPNESPAEERKEVEVEEPTTTTS